MKNLIADLQQKGIEIKTNESITGFEKRMEKSLYPFQQTAICYRWSSGIGWFLSRELAELVGITLPLMAGRGYSLTLENSPHQINHPIILAEGRVALTPMDGNKIRMGGTMEVV
jgi:D-amino-acid dehydrogenase